MVAVLVYLFRSRSRRFPIQWPLRNISPMGANAESDRKQTRKKDRDELIIGHIPFVQQIVNRLLEKHPTDIDQENLQAAGLLGLVEAADQFDPSYGAAFTTFAYPRIRGAILDELRRNCPLPQAMLKRWAEIRSAAAHLEHLADVSLIANRTGLTEREIEDCFQAVRLIRPQRWNEHLSHPHAAAESSTDEHRQLHLAEERRLLAEAMERLPNKERLALTLYYLEELTMKEIGDVLSLSESRISRLIARAEFRLRSVIQNRLVNCRTAANQTVERDRARNDANQEMRPALSSRQLKYEPAHAERPLGHFHQGRLVQKQTHD